MHSAWGVLEEHRGEKPTFISRSACASSHHSSRTVVQGSRLRPLHVLPESLPQSAPVPTLILAPMLWLPHTPHPPES